ncbi:YciI family protein [Shewanella sp. TC10]|uniref:YciI family protein n=1 Tax=Shewanella sp. TC10 TaxID=1419739 RepID=UPI00129E75AE|nr:YciI family protein [Shewanella sp. TC10]
MNSLNTFSVSATLSLFNLYVQPIVRLSQSRFIFKQILIVICFTSLSLTSACFANTNPQYEQQLAESLNADEYGMKRYVMAFLKRGPNRDRSEYEAAKLQHAHMENIGQLAEAGKLIVAGPFIGKGELRGIYIFNVETIAEAKALTETDPAIQAGSLVMDLLPWYGSAALMKVNDIHNKVAKTLM